MIADTTGQAIEIIRENEIGLYDTVVRIATYVTRFPDGRCYVRLKDGETFFTNNKTIIVEGVK
jgi:hypothetical protein